MAGRIQGRVEAFASPSAGFGSLHLRPGRRESSEGPKDRSPSIGVRGPRDSRVKTSTTVSTTVAEAVARLSRPSGAQAQKDTLRPGTLAKVERPEAFHRRPSPTRPEGKAAAALVFQPVQLGTPTPPNRRSVRTEVVIESHRKVIRPGVHLTPVKATGTPDRTGSASMATSTADRPIPEWARTETRRMDGEPLLSHDGEEGLSVIPADLLLAKDRTVEPEPAWLQERIHATSSGLPLSSPSVDSCALQLDHKFEKERNRGALSRQATDVSLRSWDQTADEHLEAHTDEGLVWTMLPDMPRTVKEGEKEHIIRSLETLRDQLHLEGGFVRYSCKARLEASANTLQSLLEHVLKDKARTGAVSIMVQTGHCLSMGFKKLVKLSIECSGIMCLTSVLWDYDVELKSKSNHSCVLP